MKTINYNTGSVILNLNGEILENARSKIGKPNAYVLPENGYYKFMYDIDSDTSCSFCTKHKGEIYAYMCGILNF